MKCPVCHSSTQVAGKRKLLRGNYNPTGKRKQHPNLQWYRLPSGGRVKVCTGCLKKQSKDPDYFAKKGLYEKVK